MLTRTAHVSRPPRRTRRAHRLGGAPLHRRTRSSDRLASLPAPRRRAARARVLAHAGLRMEPGARRNPLRVPALDQQRVSRQRHRLLRHEPDDPRLGSQPDAAVDHRHAALAVRPRPRGLAEHDDRRGAARTASTWSRRRCRQPLPSYPGLLRWTPVDGAVGYQVWLVDVPKTVSVADERDGRARVLHLPPGRVLARPGALEDPRRAPHPQQPRRTGFPPSPTGPGAPSTPPSTRPSRSGPTKPVATVSDVVATGAARPLRRTGSPRPSSSAATSRSQARPTELYRVHVFTDKRCVNRVYSSSIVGSPAYAPRYSGPLALPRTPPRRSVGAGTVPAGRQGRRQLRRRRREDHGQRVARRGEADPRPAGRDRGRNADHADRAHSARRLDAARERHAAPATGGSRVVRRRRADQAHAATLGPPVGLWDTDWSNGGGYYWTVVPVRTIIPEHGLDRARPEPVAAIGGTILTVASIAGFTVGDAVMVGNTGIVRDPSRSRLSAANTITIAPALTVSHAPGETVVRTAASLEYQDAELAQDACAAGRVMRFGKESEPTLTAGGEAFASGLTPNGKLGSAEEPALPSTAPRSSPGRPRSAPRSTRCSGARRATRSSPKPIRPPGDGDHDAEHLRGAAARARHLVLPRARLRLLAAAGGAGDVVVGAAADRRHPADVRRRRRERIREDRRDAHAHLALRRPLDQASVLVPSGLALDVRRGRLPPARPGGLVAAPDRPRGCAAPTLLRPDRLPTAPRARTRSGCARPARAQLAPAFRAARRSRSPPEPPCAAPAPRARRHRSSTCSSTAASPTR